VCVKVQTPLGNQTTPRHVMVIQCKKYGDTPKNVFSRAWQEKYKKRKERQKRTHIWTLYFTPLPGRPCVADFYHFGHVGSHRRHNHPCQILVRLVEGLGGYGCPKSGVSHWLWSSPLQVLRTTVQHCEFVILYPDLTLTLIYDLEIQ